MEEGLEQIGELDDTTQLDSEKNDTFSSVKTHFEIVTMIKELKEFEQRFSGFEIVDVEVSEELIEVEHSELLEMNHSEIEDEIRKSSLGTRLKKYKVFRIKVRSKSDITSVKKPVKSATFKIRFDESGNLVNTDFKNAKSKEPSKFKAKILGKLPKLKKPGLKRKNKKKEESGEASESSEEGGKKSKNKKLKGGLGKIGKLKGVIPNKSKKKEKKSKKEK